MKTSGMQPLALQGCRRGSTEASCEETSAWGPPRRTLHGPFVPCPTADPAVETDRRRVSVQHAPLRNAPQSRCTAIAPARPSGAPRAHAAPPGARTSRYSPRLPVLKLGRTMQPAGSPSTSPISTSAAGLARTAARAGRRRCHRGIRQSARIRPARQSQHRISRTSSMVAGRMERWGWRAHGRGSGRVARQRVSRTLLLHQLGTRPMSAWPASAGSTPSACPCRRRRQRQWQR